MCLLNFQEQVIFTQFKKMHYCRISLVSPLCLDYNCPGGARWLSGRASDSGAREGGVRNLLPPSFVLEQETLLPESTGNIQKAVALSRYD